MASRYLGGIGSLHVLRSLLGQYEWRFEMYPWRDAGRMVKNEFRQILHPNAVLPLKIDGVNVPMQKRVTLLAFLTTCLLYTSPSLRDLSTSRMPSSA